MLPKDLFWKFCFRKYLFIACMMEKNLHIWNWHMLGLGVEDTGGAGDGGAGGSPVLSVLTLRVKHSEVLLSFPSISFRGRGSKQYKGRGDENEVASLLFLFSTYPMERYASCLTTSKFCFTHSLVSMYIAVHCIWGLNPHNWVHKSLPHQTWPPNDKSTNLKWMLCTWPCQGHLRRATWSLPDSESLLESVLDPSPAGVPILFKLKSVCVSVFSWICICA